MERAKEFVPWNFKRAVITFKIAVVHLVVERAQSQSIFVLYDQSLEPCMRRCSGQRVVLQVEQNVDRVCGNNPMDQDRA